MSAGKVALVGIDNMHYLDSMCKLLISLGFEVRTAIALEGMLMAMGLSEDSIDDAPSRRFDVYCMDATFGQLDLSPARVIYKHARDSKFISISNNPEVIAQAQKEGIPCYDKRNVEGIISALEME